jgi:hypothetical protein
MFAGLSLHLLARRGLALRGQLGLRERKQAKVVVMGPVPMRRTRPAVAQSIEIVAPLLEVLPLSVPKTICELVP